MKDHIWVIEAKRGDGNWQPTIAFIDETKKSCEKFIKEMKEVNYNERMRVKKYRRVGR